MIELNKSRKYARLAWKPIPGLNGYEASEDGRIRHGKNPIAIGKTDCGVPCIRIKAIEWHEDAIQYKTVELEVARLVAAAFLGKPPPGCMKIPVHRNSDYTDCAPDNLVYEPDEDAEFRFFDQMMRDPGFPINQSRRRYRVWR
ncbi:NUMOD4 domain-containing protein [Mycobacteroides abscessus]|uniref:NUMOD4 domain-containing protein n=1 Tax=Mycobacteroides abscessus TaxID=36809 RepID=UPI000D3E6505|nr:hypothetical protein DDJ68_01735 [Mycobacteroides abscessus]